MAITKKPENNKCWQECGETESLVYCWLEYKMAQILWKTAWQYLKKIENIITT